MFSESHLSRADDGADGVWVLSGVLAVWYAGGADGRHGALSSRQPGEWQRDVVLRRGQSRDTVEMVI